MSRKLVFLKLGGSLITAKNRPHSARLEVLERLAQEIAFARSQDRDLQIVLGHGSGSFGHFPASKYKTRMGVKTTEEWTGFIEVWREAAELNHLVLQALEKACLPALAFPPSSMVIAHQGMVATWNLDTLQHALAEDLLPVIYGDVVFDTALGGTILSTEDLFTHLAHHIPPVQLLFAGNQPGVWADFPDNTSLLPEITPGSLPQIETGLSGSAAMDVTGGMADKVRQVLSLVEAFPGINASIFSGEIPGNVQRALLGEVMGTAIHSAGGILV
jgi:isopentenyl phosphate kinase